MRFKVGQMVYIVVGKDYTHAKIIDIATTGRLYLDRSVRGNVTLHPKKEATSNGYDIYTSGYRYNPTLVYVKESPYTEEQLKLAPPELPQVYVRDAEWPVKGQLVVKASSIEEATRMFNESPSRVERRITGPSEENVLRYQSGIRRQDA